MNDLQNEIRRSAGYVTPRDNVRRLIQQRGTVLTEGQIETAGRTYVKATVWAMLAQTLISGLGAVVRVVMGLALMGGLAWLAMTWK